MDIDIVHKKKEFKDEQELRLIYPLGGMSDSNKFWGNEQNEIGQKVEVDLNHLIDEIVLAPNSSDDEHNYVIRAIKELSYLFNVKKSDLSEDPYY